MCITNQDKLSIRADEVERSPKDIRPLVPNFIRALPL